MLFVLLIAIVLILAIFVLDSLKYGITPTSTSRKVREKILTLLPKEFNGKIADLGSGFGDFALSLSSHFESQTITCYEKARIPYCVSKIWVLFKGKSKVKVLDQDFLKEDLSQYDLIFCYLYRGVMPKLWRKFQRELKPGTWILSHTFALEGAQTKKIVYADDLYHTPIYLYQI